MRRVFRWTFNLAAAVSAVLFATFVLLWVRSHHQRECLQRLSLEPGGLVISAVNSINSDRDRLTLKGHFETASPSTAPTELWELKYNERQIIACDAANRVDALNREDMRPVLKQWRTKSAAYAYGGCPVWYDGPFIGTPFRPIGIAYGHTSELRLGRNPP